MRINFTLILALVFITITKAQISVNNNDLYKVGTYNINYVYEQPLSIFGSAGPNKVWDFTNLTVDKSVSRQIIAINNPSFSANLLELEDGDTNYAYLSNSSSLRLFVNDGKVDDISITMFNYPFTYNTITKDSTIESETASGSDIGFPSIDSVRISYKIKMTTKGDAYGTLKLPSGNYDVVRAKTTLDFIISYEGKIGNLPYIKIPGTDETVTEDMYQFLAKDKGYPLVVAQEGDTNIGFDLSILKLNPSTGSVSNISDNKILLPKPNPANNQIVIFNSKPYTETIKIYNICGTTVFESKIDAQNNIVLNTSNYANGIYFIKYSNGLTQKFVVKH